MADEIPKHIKAKEAELRTILVSAWAFSAAAVFFLGCGLVALALFGWQGWLNLTTLFVAVAMLLFFGFMAFVSWATVRFSTQSLAALKQAEADTAAAKQPGVWPPPPSRRG